LLINQLVEKPPGFKGLTPLSLESIDRA